MQATSLAQRAKHLLQSSGGARLIAIFSACFVVIACIFVASPVVTPADSRWSIHTAHSLLTGQGGRLDAYRPALEKHSNYGVETINGHPRTLFSIGPSLLALPFVAIASLQDRFRDSLVLGVPSRIEKLVASIYCAIAAVLFGCLIWMTFRDMTLTVGGLALFALATPLWSLASRALWQHGPLVLMFVVTMLLLVAGQRRPALIKFASLPLAIAFVIRPTAIVEVAVFSGYVLFMHWRQFPAFVAMSLVVALPWFALNFWIYDYPVPWYYYPNRLHGSNWTEGLLGHLFSPARGIFIYSPVLLLAFPGLFQAWKDTGKRPLHAAFVACIVLHWIMVSSNPPWYGGHTYGPRLMSDVIPFFAYFAVWGAKPLLEKGRWPVRAALVVVIAISIGMHARGAMHYAVHYWNVLPTNIDEDTARLWDWSDPPFLRRSS